MESKPTNQYLKAFILLMDWGIFWLCFVVFSAELFIYLHRPLLKLWFTLVRMAELVALASKVSLAPCKTGGWGLWEACGQCWFSLASKLLFRAQWLSLRPVRDHAQINLLLKQLIPVGSPRGQVGKLNTWTTGETHAKQSVHRKPARSSLTYCPKRSSQKYLDFRYSRSSDVNCLGTSTMWCIICATGCVSNVSGKQILTSVKFWV